MSADLHRIPPLDLDEVWYGIPLDPVTLGAVEAMQNMGIDTPRACAEVASAMLEALRIRFSLGEELDDHPLGTSILRLRGLGVGIDLACILSCERLLGALLREYLPAPDAPPVDWPEAA